MFSIVGRKKEKNPELLNQDNASSDNPENNNLCETNAFRTFHSRYILPGESTHFEQDGQYTEGPNSLFLLDFLQFL